MPWEGAGSGTGSCCDWLHASMPWVQLESRYEAWRWCHWSLGATSKFFLPQPTISAATANFFTMLLKVMWLHWCFICASKAISFLLSPVSFIQCWLSVFSALPQTETIFMFSWMSHIQAKPNIYNYTGVQKFYFHKLLSFNKINTSLLASVPYQPIHSDVTRRSRSRWWLVAVLVRKGDEL